MDSSPSPNPIPLAISLTTTSNFEFKICVLIGICSFFEIKIGDLKLELRFMLVDFLEFGVPCTLPLL
jgi:hypothetical protein